MADIITDFTQNEDNYSDGSIEDTMLSMVKNGLREEEILEKDNSWPVFYHMSYLRENILNWYPFKKDAEVLEVGAGCGAITGILCKKAKSVTCIELTKRRASINYYRHKEYDNLDIYVADLFKIDINKKFDYITVIGVLEYAAFMSKAKNPYLDFLEHLKKFLKPDGHILIAIENRIGLKYLSGAREDHTSGFFDGINGYKNRNDLKTFSKKELSDLLDNGGLSAKRFYYPLPDYKFTTSIYTDETINSFNENMAIPAYDSQRFRLFDETRMMKTLANEGVLGDFSNSFFVDCSLNENDINNDITLVKTSNNRKPEFRITTIVYKDDKKVEKLALNKKTETHLKSMAQFYEKNNTYHGTRLVKAEESDKGIVQFDYIKGKKLVNIIKESYNYYGVEGIFKSLDSYKENLFLNAIPKNDIYTPEFKSMFGDSEIDSSFLCIIPCNIDNGFDHFIIGEDKKFTLIDYEWIAEFYVPAIFILWRAIHYIEIETLKYEDKDKIYKHFLIDDDLRKVFLQWETYFTTYYVGCKVYPDKNNIPFDLNLVDTSSCLNKVSTIYEDCGNGFNNENSKVFQDVELEKQKTIQYHICENVKMLRFDPVEGISTEVKILSAEFNKNPLNVIPLNADVSSNGLDYFLSNDPAYIFNLTGECGELELTYIVKKLNNNELEVNIQNKISDFKRINDQLNKEIDEIKSKNKDLKNSIQKIKNTKSWRITAPLRKLLNLFKGK